MLGTEWIQTALEAQDPETASYKLRHPKTGLAMSSQAQKRVTQASQKASAWALLLERGREGLWPGRRPVAWAKAGLPIPERRTQSGSCCGNIGFGVKEQLAWPHPLVGRGLEPFPWLPGWLSPGC